MDNFRIIQLTVFALAVVWIFKISNDQMELMKAYKAKVDPEFPLSFRLRHLSLKGFVSYTRKQASLPSKFPDDPELEALAKKVRQDQAVMGFAMLALVVGAFLYA